MKSTEKISSKESKKEKEKEKKKSSSNKANGKSSDKKILILFAGIILTSLVAIIGCIATAVILFDDDDDGDDSDSITSSSQIKLFASDDEFDEYAETVADKQKDKNQGGFLDSFGLGNTEESTETAPAAEDAAKSTADSDTITNVQEVGVDEGDIVKAYGDYLVILRRGKIYSVDIESYKTVSKTNAYPDGFDSNGWYDEMLISDGQIIVIGYNYGQSATEVGMFSIDDAGVISHENTYFIDSNDYYSSRNYASRLVGDELILYMPYYMYFGDSYRDINFPKIHKWEKGNQISDGDYLLSKTDVYKPVQDTYYPSLHTVIRCGLDSDNAGELDCDAKAIIGPYSRNFYVSSEAIYVWVSDETYYYIDEKSDDEILERDAYVYRIDLDDNDFEAMGVKGSPIDQFSFKDDGEYLNVLVRSNAWGDSMWFPEMTDGEFALFRAPISKFSDKPMATAKKYYDPLPELEGYDVQNRFVGDYLLYGSGASWWNESEQLLYIKKVTSDNDAEELELDHSVDRIDLLGDDAVVIGTDGDDLKISSVDPKKAEVLDTFTRRNAFQGESRSHGFFYKGDDDGGVFGLPIRKVGSEYSSLWEESIEIIFVDVDDNKNMSYIGSLESNDTNQSDDNCTVSCVDWYGNSRPIFYDDRLFALIGYELIEGKISDDKLTEVERLGFGG